MSELSSVVDLCPSPSPRPPAYHELDNILDSVALKPEVDTPSTILAVQQHVGTDGQLTMDNGIVRQSTIKEEHEQQQQQQQQRQDADDGKSEKLIQGNNWIAVMTAAIVAIGSFSTGTVFGYSSPSTPDLNDNRNPFHLTKQQDSWVGSIITLGGLFGGLAGGPYMDYLGRKLSSLTIAVPFAIGWVIILCSNGFACLLVGRLVTGICTGFLLLICPVYIGEIAPPSIRGLLGSFHQFAITLGILFSYVCGNFLHWTWIAVACSAVLPVFVFAVSFIPETPRWLLSVKKSEAAEDALQRLRGQDTNIKVEFFKIEESMISAQQKVSWNDFRLPQVWKPLLITSGLMIFQQCSGINVVMFYTVDIFKMAQSSLDPNMQTVIVGICGVVGTVFSVLISDIVGRRILLLVSGFLMSVSMGGLGAFFYLLDRRHDFATDTLYWLPILCLVLYNFGFNVAYGPIPWVIMGELFPLRVKGAASSTSTVVNRLLAFCMTRYFSDIVDAIGAYGAYWMCCGFSVLSIPFVIFCMPETKGKTLEEIEQYFSGNKKNDDDIS